MHCTPSFITDLIEGIIRRFTGFRAGQTLDSVVSQHPCELTSGNSEGYSSGGMTPEVVNKINSVLAGESVLILIDYLSRPENYQFTFIDLEDLDGVALRGHQMVHDPKNTQEPLKAINGTKGMGVLCIDFTGGIPTVGSWVTKPDIESLFTSLVLDDQMPAAFPYFAISSLTKGCNSFQYPYWLRGLTPDGEGCADKIDVIGLCDTRLAAPVAWRG